MAGDTGYGRRIPMRGLSADALKITLIATLIVGIVLGMAIALIADP
jgi:hypothetical protein